MSEERISVQDTVGFAQYDALRCEYEDRMDTQRVEMISEKDKEVKRWQRALLIVSSVLFVIIVGIFGSVIYVLDTYDFTTVNYEQYNDGQNNMNTGSQGDVSYEPEVKDN